MGGVENGLFLMAEQIGQDIAEPELISDMRTAFLFGTRRDWRDFIDTSASSKRDYGSRVDLLIEYDLLKTRWKTIKWLKNSSEANK